MRKISREPAPRMICSCLTLCRLASFSIRASYSPLGYRFAKPVLERIASIALSGGPYGFSLQSKRIRPVAEPSDKWRLAELRDNSPRSDVVVPPRAPAAAQPRTLLREKRKDIG